MHPAAPIHQLFSPSPYSLFSPLLLSHQHTWHLPFPLKLILTLHLLTATPRELISGAFLISSSFPIFITNLSHLQRQYYYFLLSLLHSHPNSSLSPASHHFRHPNPNHLHLNTFILLHHTCCPYKYFPFSYSYLCLSNLGSHHHHRHHPLFLFSSAPYIYHFLQFQFLWFRLHSLYFTIYVPADGV